MLIAVALAAPASANRPARQVAMKDVAFQPPQISVNVGDTMTWHNADIVAHTATSRQGGFDVSVPPGGTGSAVINRSGTFDYICRYHPNMQGRIVVKP
jgi:plastocyanin